MLHLSNDTLYIEFQFHKGTIKTDLSHNDVFSCAPFQFHKGTIKTSIRQTELTDRHHFNSIKVRLKLGILYENMYLLPFQFHKGTIKTLCRIILRIALVNFNSIKVRLKPLQLSSVAKSYYDFNSIKVRLKLIRDYNTYSRELVFQFHKGTIKTIQLPALLLVNRISIP